MRSKAKDSNSNISVTYSVFSDPILVELNYISQVKQAEKNHGGCVDFTPTK